MNSISEEAKKYIQELKINKTEAQIDEINETSAIAKQAKSNEISAPRITLKYKALHCKCPTRENK